MAGWSCSALGEQLGFLSNLGNLEKKSRDHKKYLGAFCVGGNVWYQRSDLVFIISEPLVGFVDSMFSKTLSLHVSSMGDR